MKKLLTSQARIKEKGQLTIPSKIRSKLGIHEGDTLLITALEDRIILRPKVKDVMEKAGMLGRDEGVDRVKELVWKYEKKSKH